MTQEKKLLFQDICARLPYHVRCKIWLKDGTTEEGPLDLEHNYGNVLQHAFYYNDIKDIKPYLRPMSSMTEEEKKEADRLFTVLYDRNDVICGIQINSFVQLDKVIEWLNKHHFDYRELIEKSLALEAPKGMYNTK